MLSALLLHSIEIVEPGQQKFFEIKMPADAEMIIGIETGIIRFSCAASLAGNWIAGDLKIQSLGKVNLCYNTEVALGVSGMEQLMPGFPATVDAHLSELWTTPYSGGIYTEPTSLGLKNCTELYCSYKDYVGSLLVDPASYTVNVYIWYLRK